HARERRLGDRGRPDPLGAELLQQRRQRIGRHVEDLGVAPHLLGDGFEGGLVIRQLSHRPVLASKSSSPPRKRGSRASERTLGPWIPAFAGMTVYGTETLFTPKRRRRSPARVREMGLPRRRRQRSR